MLLQLPNLLPLQSSSNEIFFKKENKKENIWT